MTSAAEQQSAVAEEVNQNINRIHEASVATSAGSKQLASSSPVLAKLADHLQERGRFFSR